MNRTEWDKIIYAAVSATFENMAFMEVLTLDESPSLEDVMWTSILVHNPTQGELSLAIPKELLVKITETILGSTQEEVTEKNLKDILAEMLNTIAGRFLSEIIPDDQTFRLGLPVSEQEEYSSTDSAAITWYFTIDETPFSLSASGAPLLQLCES